MLDELPQQEIDPVELQKTLLGFLGQTYQEVAKFDNHLVNPNSTLAPKKLEFQRIAERVISETRNPNGNPQPNNPKQNIPVSYPVRELDTRPFIDTGKAPTVPPPNDPNQLEFSFDNSVTAITINNRLNDIEKLIKRLDFSMQKVIKYVESHESENSK